MYFQITDACSRDDTTSTFATPAFQDPLTRKRFVGILPLKLNIYFRKGPGNKLLFGKSLQPVVSVVTTVSNCLKRLLVSQTGWWTFLKLIQQQKLFLFHFYLSAVFMICSLIKQGKNTASQILQATRLSEKKQNAQPTHFHISNKNNITVCCISAEAYIQEALQIIYSGPLTHMCQSVQPKLILSLSSMKGTAYRQPPNFSSHHKVQQYPDRAPQQHQKGLCQRH